QNVDSDDLQNAFEDETGMDLTWFWNEWVYKGGEPSYQVEFNEVLDQGKKSSQFIVNQIHERNEVIGLFKMPIKFQVFYEDGTKDEVVEIIENEYHQVVIPNRNSKPISYVLFDPNSEVLKTVQFKKSLKMLENQAFKAVNMIDRYDAVLAMN
ncbi:MAG: hypothetical protein AB7O73_11990, partial [Bacteroidia bacterium]